MSVPCNLINSAQLYGHSRTGYLPQTSCTRHVFLHCSISALRTAYTTPRSVASTYNRICQEVRKPENKYKAANTILGNQRP